MINYPKNPRPFEVGEEIYNLLFDRFEKISYITNHYRYPVGTDNEGYTLDGKVNIEHSMRLLYHADELPFTITAELSRPKIKKDTKVRVRNKHTDKWVNRYATGDFYKSRILCYPNGTDSFSVDKRQRPIEWSYYEIVEE